MKIKKRNMILEILVCTALAAVIFLVYMTIAKEDSGMEIRDISGDRTHLEAFSFEGIAGDSSGYHHYILESGELDTRYYPVDGMGMDAFLTAEKNGEWFGKYFSEYTYTSFSADDKLFPARGKETESKMISDITELTEENQQILKQRLDDWYGSYDLLHTGKMTGYTTDEIKVYAEIDSYPRARYARFFTGLTFSGKEYYFTEWHYPYGERVTYEATPLNMKMSVVDTEEAFYAVLKTTEDCEGEVFLHRIPKEEMASGWGSDLLWQDASQGKTEILKTFSVDAENRIIGLENIGEDRLLLARSEGDILILELYDLDGNFITDFRTDVENVSQYELEQVRLHQKADETVIWFELDRKIYQEGAGSEDFHYEIDGAKYYVCDKNSIRPLNISGYPDYLDHVNGKVLAVERSINTENRELNELLGYSTLAYKLRVLDSTTGELLYEGELTSDFEQDYYRKLTVLNIGKRAGYLSERAEKWDRWDWNQMQNTEIRVFGPMLPVHGELESENWSNTSDGYTIYRYY